MRKIFFILFLGLLSQTAIAQNISLNFKDTPLKDVLKEIQNQTDYKFVYNDDQIKASQLVSVNVVAQPLPVVLDELLVKNNIAYTINDKQIVLQYIAPVAPDSKTGVGGKTTGTVRGTITDEEGVPLPGATIVIKGTKRSILSDINGKFEISDVSPQATFEISFMGYKQKEVAVNNRSTLVVALEVDARQLNEVITIGYGTARKRDFTGSVSSIKPDAIKNSAIVTIDGMLSGQASGVSAIKADGSPGGALRIRVRGGTSLLGSNEPLYIIDGVPTEVRNNYINSSELVNPMEAANYGEDFNNSVSGSFLRGLNSLSGLNVNDIESIDILKDASATAIYGSKAANGVVIITTKRGRKDSKTVLNASYSFGVSSPNKEKVLNAEQYIKAIKDAATNYITSIEANALISPSINPNSATMVATRKILTDPNYFGTANTDWLALVLRTGYSHNADISLSGGGKTSKYYTSLAYTSQTGTLISTDFERIAGKVSLDNDIMPWARLTTNINYGFTQNNITNGLYAQALTAPPTIAPYNEDGTYASLGALNSDYRGYQNPLAVASGTNKAKSYMLKGTLALEIDFFKDLRFKSSIAVDYNNYNQRTYVPSYVDVGGFYGREDSRGGTGSQAQSLMLNTFFENTLTYNKEFNEKHSLELLLGTTWESSRSSYFSASGTGYPDDFHLNNLSSAGIPASVAGSDPERQTSLLSFYLRANYILMGKYLLTFTGRSDASSKFGPNNRVGYFPSGAIAWRLSDEGFMKDISWISEIKLRISAGKTGTQSIGDHMWRTLYSSDSYAGNPALYPSQLGNNNIRWESTVQKDIGLDFGLFNYRLSGTFGYYDKTTDGALLNLTPAPSSAFGTVIYNIATVNNKGIELELRCDFIKSRDFNWRGSFNISKNISKVTNIDGGPFSDPNDRNALNLGTSIVKEGEPLGLLYGRVVKGIITTQEQLDDYRSRFNYWIYFARELSIGDFEYELAENGLWKQDIIGHAAPKFFGGYSNTFSYKNWSLQTLFTFSYGNELIYQKDVSDISMSSLANRGVQVLNAYTPAKPSTTRPRSVYNAIMFLTNANVYDASYLKLKSLYLSYTLPKKLTSKLNAELTIYATASNLFVITKYPGPDPEVSDMPTSIIGGGRDVSTYPTTKDFSIGFRLNF